MTAEGRDPGELRGFGVGASRRLISPGGSDDAAGSCGSVGHRPRRFARATLRRRSPVTWRKGLPRCVDRALTGDSRGRGRVEAVDFEHLIERHGRWSWASWRRRWTPWPPTTCTACPRPQLLDRTAAAGAGAQPDRRRAGPHRPPRRARPGPRARRAEVDGLLAARARPALRRRGRAGWSATAARWTTCRRSPPPAPPGRSPPTRSRSSPRSTRPENLAAAADAGRRPGRRRRGAGRGRRHPPATGELAQVVHHYLARLDPDGPEPDPTEGRSLTIAKHADGCITGRFDLDAGRRGEGAGRAGVDRAGRPARRATRAPAPSSSPTPSCSWPTTPSPPATCRSCAPSNRTWSSPSASTTWSTRATGPGAATTGFGARISAARARWLACDGNISRIVIGPDGPAAGPRPHQAGRSRRTCARALDVRDKACVFTGCSAPTHWCDAHHVLEWLPTTARPRWRTPRCSANGTTPRSTTASGSNEIPTADGTPTAPTAPRSSSTPT